MQFEVYYGEISDARKLNWDNGEENPYDVLKHNYTIKPAQNWMEFLHWAEKNLSDEIQIDWGSYAWKCKGKVIKRIRYISYGYIKDLENVVDDQEYGVVFIEGI